MGNGTGVKNLSIDGRYQIQNLQLVQLSSLSYEVVAKAEASRQSGKDHAE